MLYLRDTQRVSDGGGTLSLQAYHMSLCWICYIHIPAPSDWLTDWLSAACLLRTNKHDLDVTRILSLLEPPPRNSDNIAIADGGKENEERNGKTKLQSISDTLKRLIHHNFVWQKEETVGRRVWEYPYLIPTVVCVGGPLGEFLILFTFAYSLCACEYVERPGYYYSWWIYSTHPLTTAKHPQRLTMKWRTHFATES